jgi:nucleoside-diphosphate-sugar epimerase
LTGGTGFIGSHIAAELARKGYRLYLLARSGRQLAGHERVEQLLDWLEVSPPDRSKYRVIEGYLEEPHLGLGRARCDELLEEIDEVIHCASSTSFSGRKRAEVEAANIRGLQNVLEVAAKSRCHYLHYLSTAYVAGKNGGPCREELVETDQFTNVYEETKCRGEKMAARICAEEGIRLNIYRPSIVYGNSQTGKSLAFRGLYYPIRTVLFLKDLYETDIREHGGKRAKEMGVSREADGSLHLPIRLEAHQEGGINLIPIDYFLEAFMAVMEECLEGGIFHLVNDKSKRIEELIDYTQRMFHIRGIRACHAEDFEKVPRNGLEALFDSYLEAYGPYIRDSRIFENKKAESILRKRNITCPDFDFDIFSRCMGYALDSGWGSRLLKKRQ